MRMEKESTVKGALVRRDWRPQVAAFNQCHVQASEYYFCQQVLLGV
jgi:hypothetical protein